MKDMKSLLQYINEATITDLEKLLKDNDISIDDAYKAILRHHGSKRAQDLTSFNDFFKKHGLNNLNWGRRNNAIKQFINVFAEDGKLDILTDIVENDGMISIDDLETSGNIFELCKGFEEEAKIICSWINGKNRPSGAGEILLKFLIIEASTPIEGDILIKDKYLMEVKTNTININFKNGQKTLSGGIPVGQKGDVRKSWAVYSYIHSALTGKTYKSGYFDSFKYFQNSKGFKEFNIFLQSLNITDTRKITDTITEAFLYQYRFIDAENNNTNKLSDYQIETLKDEVFEQLNPLFTEDNTINNEDKFINIIGAIQLYLYSIIEEFSYFMCLLYDKDVENESDKNGKYVLLTADDLLDFNKVLKYLTFNKFAASATKTEGRAGKIFLK
jgi:hypothetical protein